MCQFPPLHCTAYQVIPLLHFKVMSELVQDFMWEGFLQILSPQSLLSWETMMQPALDWLHGILCGGEWNGDKNADLQTGRFARLSVCRHDTIIRLFGPRPNKTHPCLSAMAQFWRRGVHVPRSVWTGGEQQCNAYFSHLSFLQLSPLSGTRLLPYIAPSSQSTNFDIILFRGQILVSNVHPLKLNFAFYSHWVQWKFKKWVAAGFIIAHHRIKSSCWS